MKIKIKTKELLAPSNFNAKKTATSHKPLARYNEEQLGNTTKEIGKDIAKLQRLLWENQDTAIKEKKRSLLVVLQGMDTSGKDGTTRGVFRYSSPIGLRLESFKAPTKLELAHDFLWRIHQVTPRTGELVIFNRSHYEDILVPGVNQWISKTVLDERLEHINAFEKLLSDNGTTIVKCMLHIGKDEQRARLQARIDRPEKHWKFDPSDLEVRKQWDDYQSMYSYMVRKSSTKYAPWHIIPSDSKPQRNVLVANVVHDALKSLKLKQSPANPAFSSIVVE